MAEESSSIIRGTSKIEIFSEMPSLLQRGQLRGDFATAAARKAAPVQPLTFNALIYPANAAPAAGAPLEIGGMAYTSDGKADVGALFKGLREETTGTGGIVQVTKGPLLTASAEDLARLTPEALRRGPK